jgi:hypothetical protein
MTTTNFNNEASGVSARHFHIVLRKGNDDNNNQLATSNMDAFRAILYHLT